MSRTGLSQMAACTVQEHHTHSSLTLLGMSKLKLPSLTLLDVVTI